VPRTTSQNVTNGFIGNSCPKPLYLIVFAEAAQREEIDTRGARMTAAAAISGEGLERGLIPARLVIKTPEVNCG
jgi:hypothetical protein